MTCQGRRHEPYWWVASRGQCRGTTTIKKQIPRTKTRAADYVKVGERRCGQVAKYGDYCRVHREAS